MNYRELYEGVYGEIPKDESGRSFEIHHKDGDHSNDSIENLVALSIQDHYNIHFEQGDFNACNLISRRIDGLSEEEVAEIRRLSSEWMKVNNPSTRAKGDTHWARGKAVVVDSAGNKLRVECDDPRIASGELVQLNANKVTVRDDEGRCYSVQKDDPRVLSGELIPASKGYKRNWTPDQVDERYTSRRGRTWSVEEREQRSTNRKPAWNKGVTGSHHSEETKMKMSVAKKGKTKLQVTCPYCEKSGGKPAMIRFHFDNCTKRGTSCSSL